MPHRVGLLTAIGRHIPAVLPIPDWSRPIILALLLLAGGSAVRAWLVSHRVRRLEGQRRDLSADLESMQAALVPDVPPRLGELDISVAYQPAAGPAAGGDFYEIFPLPDGRVAIILGDVSGHGREALAHAARMHYTLRAYVEAGLGPRFALKLAGRVAASDAGSLFTTVVIAVYDPEPGTLTYASAGHPPPVTECPSAHEPVTCCSSPALGWGAPTGRRQTTVPFPRGARACFFTDGLPESPTEHGLLGRAGIVALLAGGGFRLPAAELLHRVGEVAERTPDDMAACIVEAAGGCVTDTGTVTEELELPHDEPERGAGKRFLRGCGVSSGDTARALQRAAELLGTDRDALLTVYRTGGSANVVVTTASEDAVSRLEQPDAPVAA